MRPGFARLPADLPAVARKSLDLLIQVVAALAAALNENCAVGGTGPGENDTDLEALSLLST